MPSNNNMSIDREDMLALTRRMTVKRTSMTRIAGAYIDKEGFVDGTFNVDFLKLSAGEKEKNLAIAKAIPFAPTNKNLKRYAFDKTEKGSMWPFLMGIRFCGLKNDALLDSFYEMVGETYRSKGDYGVFLFHDCYDIPAKAADHERLGESEQVFEYLICAFCPVSGDYEPGPPECGFIFPAYDAGGAILNRIDVFQADAQHPHEELLQMLLQ